MRRLVLLSLVIPALLTACRDATGPSVTGTYHLQTVNGQAPPAVVYEDEEWRDELLSGSVTLNDGGACFLAATWRETHKPTNTVETDTNTFTCSYTISGGNITVSIAGLDTVQGTISGDTITLLSDGDILIFRR